MPPAANLPTRNNNPGDLKDPASGSFRQFSDPKQGYAALLNDLEAKKTGTTTTGLGPASTLADFAKVYAPAGDNNNSAKYAADLANKMQVSPATQLKELDVGRWADAIAGNEGYAGVPQLPQAAEVPQAPDTSTTTTPPPKNNGLLSAAVNGTKTVGNFLFPAVGDIYHDIKGDNTKTGLQQLGDIGSTALGVGTLAANFVPGLGEAADAAQAARFAEAGGSIAAKAVPSLASAVTKNAALGAGFGFSGALGKGDTDSKSIAEDTAIGAGTGGLLGAAGKLVAGKVADVAAKTPEGQLQAQTNRLKTLQKAYSDNTRPATAMGAATNPIKTLTDNGFIKGLKVVGNKVDASALANPEYTGVIDNQIEQHSSVASDLVKTLKGGVPIEDFKKQLTDAIMGDKNIRGTLSIPAVLRSLESKLASAEMSYGKVLPYTAIDEIRAGMNRVYDPTERDAARVIGDTARNILYNGNGTNAAIKNAMANEAELIRARNFVEKLQGTSVPGGNLGRYLADMVGAGVGTTVGTIMGGPFGAVVGTGIGGKATDMVINKVNSNFFNPIGSRTAGVLQKAVQSKAGQLVKGTAKAAVLRGAGSL